MTNWKVVGLAVFWGGAVVVLCIASWIYPDYYNRIWTHGALFVTLLYGALYYLYQLMYAKDIKTRFEKVVVYGAVAIFWTMCLVMVSAMVGWWDVNRAWFFYFFLDHYSYLALAAFFLGVDYSLYRSNSVKFVEEGWFARLIDLPTLVGFVLMWILGNYQGLMHLEYFLAGAHAFQLVAFNTAFTILLLYLSLFKKVAGSAGATA